MERFTETEGPSVEATWNEPRTSDQLRAVMARIASRVDSVDLGEEF